MGKMKEIAIECEGNVCMFCKHKIRAVGTERKNGNPYVLYTPDREHRYYHQACHKRNAKDKFLVNHYFPNLNAARVDNK